MLFQSPLAGKIAPDKRFYPTHKDASGRTEPRKPLVTLDFGPTKLDAEPSLKWNGGEFNIFGEPIPPRDPYKHFHKAIDISTGGCFDPVLAAAKGRVTTSEKNEHNCQVIVIEHEPIGGHRFETRYVHLFSRGKKVGDHVEAGDVIGKLGRSGAEACHLHFAVRRDGKWVDPWRRLAQNTPLDPDLPATAFPATPATPVEADDVPTPASNDEYLAGSVAFVGNETIGAKVRDAPEMDGAEIRTIPGGTTEEWLPTCWVRGELQLGSDRWLTRWNNGKWEYTHSVNVGPVTKL